jgi:gliding motility-associated-like protein
MKKWITYMHILLVCVCFTTTAYAQPANDDCSTATPITVGNGSCNSILYTNVAATSVGDPTIPACWNPSSLSHSVWFSFVATTADVEISTNFGGTLANTQLAVFSGTCGSLTQIGCQENVNTAGGLLHTDVILHGLTVGNTYYLLVDGNGATTGTFGICAQQALPVGPTLPIQDCVGAQTLCTVGDVTVPNGPGGVGTSPENPSCFGAPGERSSNWYTFTVATSGTLAFTITPTATIDYDFAIYNTSTACPGTELVCDWEPNTGPAGVTGLGCGGVQCEPTLAVVAGQTYTILVDRYTATSAAGFTMNFAGTTATFASPNPTFTATSACVGTATQFTNTTNGNFTYNWNFGDGYTSTLENPSHTYTFGGPYNVTLLLTAVPGGCQNSITQVVNVKPLPSVDAGTGGNVCPGGCFDLSGATNATGSVGPTSFSNTGNYAIPDGSVTGVNSPIVASGISPTTIAASSIASVCLNISHAFDADLDIYLKCPDGTTIELSTDNGSLNADYTNTCFTPTAAASVTTGTAPFTGNYLPEQSFNLLNGCTANGTWQLFVQDDFALDAGTILDWTITFNNNLPAYTWSPTTNMTNSLTLSPTVCPTATTTYTLTANNGVGCSSTDTVTVTYTPAISPVVTCGTITSSTLQYNWAAVAGATSYTVSYQIGANPVVNVGNVGNVTTYTLSGISSSTAVTITVTPVGPVGTCFTSTSQVCTTIACAAPAVPTISTTAPTCAANGFSTITNYNAAHTYTFSPAGPTVGAGGAITGATIGTAYTVTATLTGCISPASASFSNVIMLVTPVAPTLSTTAPTCAANGFTTITNYNAAYTYTFSPAGPTAGAGGTITGATIGTAYTITATNGGCTSAASAAFTNVSMLVTPPIPTISTTAPTCAANGFSTITNYSATNTYTFSPIGPTAGAGGTITGATIGTAYTVTATSGGCTSAASTAFTNATILPTPVTPAITTTAPNCAANGSSTITNYSAANTYTFSPAGPTVGAGGTITGATIGTAYTVTATNGGCTSLSSFSFTNVIMLASPPVPAISTTAPTCVANGFSTITNYSAANTYNFFPVGPTAGAGGTITGATIGTAYTVTATSGGCTSAASTAFTNATMLPTPVIPTITTTAPTCVANAFSTITNYSAANTYTFSPVGPNAGAGGTITGATVGTAYTVTATNGGCTSAASTAFTNVLMLVTPPIPTISTTAPTCIANGFSTITNYSAANTYTFSPIGPTAGAGGTITGATVGTAYTVTATSGGCTSAPSTAFTNATMLPTPVIPTITTTPPTCVADGFSTISNYSAANTYTFSPVGATVGAGGTITGATVGTAYTVTATNGGCISGVSAAFTNVVMLVTPPVPTIATTAPTCVANGFSTITNYSAGTTYTFSPVGPTAGAGGTITGATVGTAYTVTATNGGCTSAASTAFTNATMLPTPVIPTITTTAPTCAADGFSTITNYTAANTYTFSPVGPTTSAGGAITGAILGTAYTVTATNGGCTSAASAAFTNIIRLTTPAVPTVNTSSPNCVSDGSSTISNYAAANTYTFSPAGPTAGAGGIITGAVIGTAYTITATSGGCTSAASVAFTNLLMLSTQPAPTLVTTPPGCAVDGFTAIANYNPTNTYTFTPTGPTAGAGGTITGAVIGTAYTITATSGSCTSVPSVSFTNLIALPIPIAPTVSTIAPTCSANGSTTITNYNVANTYTFSPIGPTAGASGTITGAAFGTAYTITATNGGCTSVASVAFTNIALLVTPAVPALSTSAPTCVADGFTTITNYNAGYTYAFSPAGPTANAGGVISGATIGTAYTISASANGCTSVSSVAFTNLIMLVTPVAPTVSTTAPTCAADGFTTITNYNAANNYTFSPAGPIVGAGGTITGATMATPYTVTATNSGCTSAASTPFTNLIMLITPAVPTISTIAPTCAADGFTTITNYNAVNTYTFSPAGPTVGAGGAITGATLGMPYTVTANNGCTSASSAAFTNLAMLITPAVPTISTTPPNCVADGFSTITNYNAGYSYTFSPAGPTSGAGGTITGAVIGTAYTVTATSGSCISAASAAFTNLLMLSTQPTPTLSITAPTCAADGFTTITNYNATNTYTFTPAGPNAGIGGLITGAVIGTAYTVTATSGPCTSVASVSFTNLIMLVTPVAPTVSTTAPTCLADGFTIITNYNAANTYTFSPVGPTAGAGGTISGAIFGTSYTVTAANGGCTSIASLPFTNLGMLTTPAIPTTSTTAPTCAADGFTTITNYNATDTYTFSPAGPTVSAGGTITGTTLGTIYTVTATNGGCTSAASTAFTDIVKLTTPTVPTINTSSPNCVSDGSSTISNYSVANIYTFSPVGPTAGAGGTIMGAVIGTAYTVTATSGGCTSAASTAFTNLLMLSTQPAPTLSVTAPTCAADGFTMITNYNATNTYTFTPVGPNAGVGGLITGAVIGTAYTVTATSGTCTSVASVSFTNLIMLVTPVAPTISTTAPTCLADGFTIITNYNAANTYTFSPVGPTAGAGGTITGAIFGTPYTVTAANGGCTSIASLPFTNLVMLTTPAIPTTSTTAPTCAADGFTTITNYNAADTYTFSPVGPTAGAGGTITGATLGTAYTITSTNGGCTSATSVAFTNALMLVTPVVPTIITTPPNCVADGFTTITNYNASYLYTFTPIGPTAGLGGAIIGAVVGTAYTITATSGSCTSASSVAFTNLLMLSTQPAPTLSLTAPTCAADGFTTITNYNATNTYTFTPAGPTAGVGGLITGAVVGTAYTVTATSGPCTSVASGSFTNLIMLVTPIAPTVSTTAPTCLADGFTVITNYNAANTYTFSPVGPTAGAGGTITGAIFGTLYTATAANGGCTSTASLSFTNLVMLTTPAIPTTSTTAPTCAADGFTMITNYNAADTYTFSPIGPTVSAGGTVTATVFGTVYTVTATNGGCTSTASLAFTNLIMLVTPNIPTLSITPPTCVADGFTTITNYNAANTYIFSPAGPSVAAGGSINGAILGTSYTITATNGLCTSLASASFTNLIKLVDLATPILSTTAPSCAADGFTTITNFIPAYTYTFSPVGPTAGPGGIITGATIGTSYTVIATQGICTSLVSASFTNLVMLFTPSIPALSVTVPTCITDGFTTITNYNAANSYVFSPIGPTTGAGGTITGAVLGTTYALTATNGGCTSAASTAFTNLVMLVTPAVPTISTTAPTCAADGFTVIANYNGANTYTFSPIGPTAGAGGTITGATIGTAYTVTATSGGCTSASSVAFTNLIQLSTPSVPTISTTPPNCLADGFTTIGNYSASYTYTFTPVGPTVGAGGTITGAVIGTAYSVTATSGICTSVASVVFTNLVQLTTQPIPTTSTTAPSCAADGFTVITNYNGANTYTFSPIGPTAGAGGTITGATIGTAYTVTATSGGCTSASSIAFTNVIMLVTPAVPTLSTTAPTCVANGFTTITNYNTANNYVFSPTGPTAGAGGTISGATIGIAYSITANNGNCTSTASSTFTNLMQLTTPVAPTLSTTAPSCAADGFTIITNYNGANIYSFSPVGPTTGAGGTIIGATLGNAYTVTANNGSCTSVVSIPFTNIAMLVTPAVPTLSTTAPTCAADGFTTITNYSAANTYTFSPFGPSVGPSGIVNGAVIGIAYTVTASSSGCISAASASFTNLIILVTPAVPTTSTTAPTCDTDGFTVITNYNAAIIYAFSPSGPTVSAGGAISGAVVGTAYTVTANNGSCTSPASSSFTNAPLLFNISTTSPPPLHFCDDNNDGFGTFNLTQVIPTVTGGNPTYIVTFHETTTDATIGGTTIPIPINYFNIDVNIQTIYIRVASNITGCFGIIPLQLIVDPKPEATEPADYRICDLDSDGFANFDLTSVISEVFGTINQTTHTISFYTSLGNAQLQTGAIVNLAAFTSAGQTIWIDIVNNITGCADTVTLELIVDPIPLATQPNYPPYSLCDVALPLAYEQFDLGSRIDAILLGQLGMNVTFHLTQSDAFSDSNPLPLLYTNGVPFVQTLWIRIENANTGCFVLSTMDIRIEPLPTPIPPNTAYTICDNNQDGYGTFDLDSLTIDILQGANYTITYHETYVDAQSGSNALVSPYDNITPFTQFIYVLAIDNVNGCRNVIPIELHVDPQPITPFTVPNLVQCDDDNNPQSGTMFFDLTQNDAAVLAIQPLTATTYTVSYYISQAHAMAGIPEIVQSANYLGTNHQIIWVRVENKLSHCFSVGSFELIINAPLVLPTPAPLNVCDADANPNNQYTAFDLTVRNTVITGGQLNMTITYYPTYPVTASSVAIPNPTAYTNISPAVQTLGVMVTTPDGCKSYTTLDIRVLPIPVPNLNGIRPLTPQCDVNNTGDMLEIFDLTVNASNIINGDPTLTLHYYPTQTDAMDDTNEILFPSAVLVGQNVWIRVENNRVDYLGENCFVLVEQPLTVNPLPTTITPAVVQNCDDDNDGQTLFDLTLTPAAFYANANVTVTYYTSAADAQAGTASIANPTAYLNLTNPQIIYIRVVDNITGCINYAGQFTLTVNPKPTATAPADFDTCDTDGTNNGFFDLDLSTYISGVIGAQTGVDTTFYNTQNDAINATNPITDLVNYQTYTHTIWIRVEDTTTGCYQLVPFDTTVEELAEPIITSPSDTICVEFGTNVLLSGLILDSGITNPNYTFEWSLGGSIVPGTGSTYPVNTVAPGDYTVVATSTSPLGCVSNPSPPFTVVQSGPAQFGTPPFTVSNYFDNNQVITVNVVGFGVYEYSLDDGPFQSSNIFEHAALGEHSVTVKDVKGNTSCGDISISGVQTISYPHYFTPDGDGIHDTWNVVGLEDQLNAKLYIFDRYGKLLKQLSTNGEGWDGNYNGHQLPSTDYWFKIEYQEQAQLKEFKGHFSLKR